MLKLTQPFKCPVKDYIPCYSMKTLGMRLPKPRRPLYDPDMINALVLYIPPEMSEQEKLTNRE